tara:strand:+ start:566 stop:976 length:411 start_codon:yes stop_codon:yes gene_type:complete
MLRIMNSFAAAAAAPGSVSKPAPIVVLFLHSSTHEPTRWALDNQLVERSLCYRLHAAEEAHHGAAAPLDITYVPVNVARSMDRKIGLSCHGSLPQWRADMIRSTLQPHFASALYRTDITIASALDISDAQVRACII